MPEPTDSDYRIALSLRVDSWPARGEQRDAIDQRWPALLQRLGFIPLLISNRMQDVHSYLQHFQPRGFVLTGGNDIDPKSSQFSGERNDTEQRILDYARSRMLPVIGVCRGFQMMNRYFGGYLCKTAGHAGTSHSVDWLLSPATRWVVNSYHDFAIAPKGLGHALIPLARADDGSIEAARHSSLPWLGLMWHPERPLDNELSHQVMLGSWLRGDSVQAMNQRGTVTSPA
jgi:putative glutamine amidotransferase